jgi:hypothetical protein
VGDRIELPSGGWVELKDELDDIRAGTRKKLLKEAGFGEEDGGGDQIDRSLGLGGAVAHFAVERYQLSYRPFHDAIRVNMIEEDWDELKVADQDALIMALQPVINQLISSQPTPDDMRPGSPTRPAGE